MSKKDQEKRDKELVEQGRKCARLMDVAQLRLGRLALEYAPMGERGHKSGAGGRVEEYAEKIGVNAKTLRFYRSVAHAWATVDVREDEVPYSLLKSLAPVSDKEKVLSLLNDEKPPDGWTIEAAESAVIKQGLWQRPKPRTVKPPPTLAEMLMSMAERLSEYELADDTSESDRQHIGEALGALLGEVEKIKRALSREKDATVEKEPKQATTPDQVERKEPVAA